ncbi:MAG TPA: membrane-bound lytic murein transglycosylase MltF [Gallionella sp.]
MPALLICSTLLLAACGQQLPAWHSGKLVIVVPEIEQGAEAEFERELAQLFAVQLHATLETVPLSQDKISAALTGHQAHLAAASLRSEINNTALQFGPSYQSVRELLVCNRDRSSMTELADLKGKEFAVVAGSAQEVALREAQGNLPALQWQARHNFTAMDLLAEVAEGTLDCTVANQLQLAEARNYHPNLVAALDVAPPSRLAWGFPMDVDPGLLGQVQIFFARIRQDGTLHRLMDRYYGHNNRLDRQDAAAFITGIRTVLPRYRPLFEEAATITGEDWRLLAALAYQESQWDPLATSYTNVRGMMMLTEDTADRMKVNNRLDARESILAGAKYLMLLKEQMPSRIPEPDRTWLALAAYNNGYGHLEDARVLTHRAGLNRDSWLDVKKQMPLLNRPGYYRTLKHGYARGGEAVILVESIRNYYDMLKRLEPGPTQSASEQISYQLIGPLQRLLR